MVAGACKIAWRSPILSIALGAFGVSTMVYNAWNYWRVREWQQSHD